MKLENFCKVFTVLCIGGLISGCFETNGVDFELQEIVSGVNNKKAQAAPPPLPKLEEIKTQKYTAVDGRDPMVGKQYISDDVITESGSSIIELTEDPARPVGYIPEPLEAYSLATLKLLGTMQKNGQAVALIQTGEGLTHTVGVGNYIGNKFGRVTNIKESFIQVEEKEFSADKKEKIIPAILNLETKPL